MAKGIGHAPPHEGRIDQKRRSLLGQAAVLSIAGAAGLLSPPQARAALRSLDPVNPNMFFGVTSGIWDDEGIERAIKTTARFGIQGMEFYPRNIQAFTGATNNPYPLIKMFKDVGLEFVSCSNGAKGESTNFIDPAKAPKTIADHMRFAHEFLVPFKAKVWKVNLGSRPAGGPNEEQIKTLASTLNELGRQTAALGIRLAPHPHIWGPMEREPEVRQVMALTDPKYVWLTMDTGHLTLGGMDAVKMISDFYPRVAEIHLKDCDPKHRGNASTPTKEEHARATLYKGIGAGGGVDFPAVFKILRERNFKGWVAMDLSAPRADDGTGSVDDNLAVSVNYLRNKLGVKLPPPPRPA